MDHSAQEKSRYRASRNEYCKKNLGEISKLLITHPLKTQTIGTGIVINEIPFLTSFVMKHDGFEERCGYMAGNRSRFSKH